MLSHQLVAIFHEGVPYFGLFPYFPQCSLVHDLTRGSDILSLWLFKCVYMGYHHP